VSGGGIRIGGPGAKDAIDPQSPTFQRAQKACGALGPGFGVTKGPGGGDRGPSVSSAP
jgi:hypothetical protein